MKRHRARRLRKPDQFEIDNARRLRLSMTEAERVLWSSLRGRASGAFKFRRQHPLGPYVADFYCAEVQLVVELDGTSHDARKEFDARRQRWLESQGIQVLRFSNHEVLQRLQDVLGAILSACRARRG